MSSRGKRRCKNRSRSRRADKPKLTESDWALVFELRCKSKRGIELSPEQHNFCVRAFREDEKRYSAMDAGVFNATVPFGSEARYSGT